MLLQCFVCIKTIKNIHIFRITQKFYKPVLVCIYLEKFIIIVMIFWCNKINIYMPDTTNSW